MAAAPSWARIARVTLVPMLFLAFGADLQADEQRYDYDPLGRLVRSVEGTNANEYLYDPAGNLLQVTDGTAQPPIVIPGDLGDFRRNEYKQAAISGSHLAGATIRPSHGGIRIDNVTASASAISFRVAVTKETPLGAHHLIVGTAAGAVTVSMNVLPGFDATIEPLPIVVPPDSVARKFTVRLAEASTENQSYSISTYSPAIARTQADTVHFAVGQSAADIGLIGVATGATALRMSGGNMIEPVEFMVSVAPGAGSQQIHAHPIGLTRGAPLQRTDSSTVISKSVSITRGLPFQRTNDSTIVGKSVGITRGTPLVQSPESLVITPPVGITKP
ncbi:MAG: RHS repeat domain-containing protein [Pseudomonadota bacterium]